MPESINEKKHERKFGKLVESIGKATNRYRRTKKETEGEAGTSSKDVRKVANNKHKAKIAEDSIDIDKLPAISKMPK